MRFLCSSSLEGSQFVLEGPKGSLFDPVAELGDGARFLFEGLFSNIPSRSGLLSNVARQVLANHDFHSSVIGESSHNMYRIRLAARSPKWYVSSFSNRARTVIYP